MGVGSPHSLLALFNPTHDRPHAADTSTPRVKKHSINHPWCDTTKIVRSPFGSFLLLDRAQAAQEPVFAGCRDLSDINPQWTVCSSPSRFVFRLLSRAQAADIHYDGADGPRSQSREEPPLQVDCWGATAARRPTLRNVLLVWEVLALQMF